MEVLKKSTHYTLVLLTLICMTSLSHAYFSKDGGAGPQSTDPVGDINEVAVLYGKLYGFDGRVFGAAMTGVFSVECNLKQNCTSPRAYQGSFQNGPNEYKIGIEQAKQNIRQMQAKGIITSQQVARFEAALRAAGNDGRLHHLATVWSSLARHAELNGPFQTAFKGDTHRIAGAQLSFQFAMTTRDRILRGVNGGLDGQLTSAEVRAFANNKGQPGSTLRQSVETITRNFQQKIDTGIRLAAQQTGVSTSQYNPDNSFFSTKENRDAYSAATQTSPYGQNSSQTSAASSPTSGSTGVAGSSSPQSQQLSQQSPLYDPSLQRYAPETTSVAELKCVGSTATFQCDSTVATRAKIVSDAGITIPVSRLTGTARLKSTDVATTYTLTCDARGVEVGRATCEVPAKQSVKKTTKTDTEHTPDDSLPDSGQGTQDDAPFEEVQSQRVYPPKRNKKVAMHITADPLLVRRGGSTRIVWTASGVEYCFVTGPRFSQTGFMGDIEVALDQKGIARFVLSCENKKRERVTDEAIITVR